MTFKKTKNISMALLLAGFVIALIGNFTISEGTSEYVFTFIASLTLILAGIGILLIWCKCPKCKRRIFYKVYTYKKCPKCGANLLSDKYNESKGPRLK